MRGNNTISGYLDVKISDKCKRGLTPWKAWQKQWCELKSLNSIENGIELKLKTSKEGSLLSCIIIPRSSTVYRTESHTKQYAFGVFASQKPLIYLSATSETDAQKWILSIRKMLSVAAYLPIGDTNFHISIVDNVHSRSAGLVGLYGILNTNPREIVISDPCTGVTVVSWNWHQFHQFHFQAPAQVIDDKRIIVMHTSGEFSAGPGQIYLYCEQGSRLLCHLVTRGKRCTPTTVLKSSRRLSRSEGDLCCNINSNKLDNAESPICVRSQTGSEDSGVSDDSQFLAKPKTASSLDILTKTPGGSETNDSLQDLTNIEDQSVIKCNLPRQESGISIASGIYEEIPDSPIKPTLPKVNHVYENPIDVILDINSKLKKHCKPPPLPPRLLDFKHKQRCNTLPAKDLSRISQMFTAESEYVVMNSSLHIENQDKGAESFYLPMSSGIKSKIENCYMVMSGRK